MMKNITALIRAILLCALPLLAATRADVVPINWAGVDLATPLTDSFSVKLLRLHNTSLKYVLNYELDSLTTAADGYFNFPSYDEIGIRPSAHEAFSLAVSLITRTYDPVVAGRDTTAAWAMLTKVIASLAMRHGSWGYAWQSAHWTHNVGLAAWLVWERLDTITQNRVADMVAKEASRFYDDPPYCNDCTDDTKAEENAWNTNAISLAVSMMPSHANASSWAFRTSQWMVSSYARQSDMDNPRFVDGKPVKEWITGWNMREEGYVYNHGLIHPDYMSASEILVWSALPHALALRYIPQSSLFNLDVVYRCFTDYVWTVPPYRSPGGTIYRRDSARVYFPQGTDWSPNRVDNYLSSDVCAWATGMDRLSSVPASSWFQCRADHLLAMQARTPTGQLFIDGELDFVPKEGLATYHFAFIYLTMLLKREGLLQAGNLFHGVLDSTPPSAPAGLIAQASAQDQTDMSWNAATDGQSGIEGYYLYRDSLLVGSSRDTFSSDISVDFRLVAGCHYSVSAVNRSGVEGPRSAEVWVPAPADTAAFVLEKILAVNDSLLILAFSKPVDTAQTESAYDITGVLVKNAALSASQDQVILTLSSLSPGQDYDLNFTLLKDRSGSDTLDSGPYPFTFSGLNRKLAGYWPLDEAKGRTVYDLSGNENNGTCLNGYDRTGGVAEGAVHFLPGGYARMAYGLTGLRFPFSFSVWMYKEDDSTRSIMATEDVSGQYFGAWMGVNAAGQVTVNIGNGGSPGPDARKSKVSAATVALNAWTHLAAVFSSATDMAVYINGTEAGGTYSGTAVNMAHGATGKVQLGYQASAVTPLLYYKGSLDEVRVYDTALTQAQVTALYTEPPLRGHDGSPEPGLVSLETAPNPFNPSVRIRLKGYRGTGEARIYSADGRLADSFLLQGGALWNAGKRPSGVYMVKVTAGKQEYRTKMVLIR